MQYQLDLIHSHVAILGLGLMGGSLALALRPFCRSLSVYDLDVSALEIARQMNLADVITDDLPSALIGRQLIIMATPINGIIRLLQQLPYAHTDEAVVIDIGSTKREICRAMEALPERFDPIGGHPMAGKAASGLAYAEADIFYNAAFALTALPRTTEKARKIASELVQVLGADPVWVDADTHDRWVSHTSHIPYLMSIALSMATPLSARPLVGPGFRSTARLASSSALMMRDVLTSNRDHVLEGLQGVKDILNQLERAVETGEGDELMALIELAYERHRILIGEPVGG